MSSKQRYTDLAYLEQFTKGDTDRLKKYLRMYLSSAPAVIEELYHELERENFENLRLKAHSIKPQAQYLGIDSLKDVLIEIEHIVKNGGDYSKLRPLVDSAKMISEEVKTEVNELLDRV